MTTKLRRVIIDDKEGKQSVTFNVELQLTLDQKMFERVHVHTKAHYELELQKTKRAMAPFQDFVLEITSAFPEIKFDATKCCFYNEAEEIVMWGAAKGRSDKELPVGKSKTPGDRNSCGCCCIF